MNEWLINLVQTLNSQSALSRSGYTATLETQGDIYVLGVEAPDLDIAIELAGEVVAQMSQDFTLEQAVEFITELINEEVNKHRG